MTARRDLLLFDADGEPFEPSSSVLDVPTRIGLDASLLVWDDDHMRKVRPRFRAFEQFLSLERAEPEAILEYARHYGPLQLCKRHNLPVYHSLHTHRFAESFQQTCRIRRNNGDEYAEPLSAWRKLARTASTTLRIITRLRDDQLGSQTDWNIISSGPVKPVFVIPGGRTVGVQRLILSWTLRAWLDAGVRVSFRWRGESSVPYLTGGLLGFIALELVAVYANQRHGINVCSICFRPYPVIGRRPKVGTAHLCGSDRCKAENNRLNQQRSRSKRL
jgi:hypothetical protein